MLSCYPVELYNACDQLCLECLRMQHMRVCVCNDTTASQNMSVWGLNSDTTSNISTWAEMDFLLNRPVQLLLLKAVTTGTICWCCFLYLSIRALQIGILPFGSGEIWSGYVWHIDCLPTFGWFWSALLCDSTSQPMPQLEPIFLHLKVQRRNHSAVLSSHRVMNLLRWNSKLALAVDCTAVYVSDTWAISTFRRMII